MTESYGALLRQYRQKAGLTMKALQYPGGVSALSELENGKRPPPQTLSRIVSLAEAVGAPARKMVQAAIRDRQQRELAGIVLDDLSLIGLIQAGKARRKAPSPVAGK